jgi:hypothetical protein
MRCAKIRRTDPVSPRGEHSMSYPPPPGHPPPGQPQPGYGYPPPRRRTGPLVVAVVIGLVVGAGAVGLTWLLSTPSDADADAAAVCGVLDRTPVPTDEKSMESISEEDFRRWAIAEVGPSMAKRDPDLEPLADALGKILPAIQRFEIDEARKSIDRAAELCDDL